MDRRNYTYGIAADDDIAAFIPSEYIHGIISELAKGPEWINGEPTGAAPAQQTEWTAIPKPLQEAYGVGTGSPAGGSWLEYSVADMEAIGYELKRDGHTLVRDDELVARACAHFAEQPANDQRFVHIDCALEDDKPEPAASTTVPADDLQSILGAVTTHADWNFALTRIPEEPTGTMRIVLAPKPNVHYVAKGTHLTGIADAAYQRARIDTHPRRFHGSIRRYAGYGADDNTSADIETATTLLNTRFAWFAALNVKPPLEAHAAAVVTAAFHAAIEEGWFLHLSAATNRPRPKAFACHVRTSSDARVTEHGWTATGAIIRALTLVPTHDQTDRTLSR